LELMRRDHVCPQSSTNRPLEVVDIISMFVRSFVAHGLANIGRDRVGDGSISLFEMKKTSDMRRTAYAAHVIIAFGEVQLGALGAIV
jgi:hypothetical protein